MIKNVLILVGGFGKRLGDLTKITPKPLLLINKRLFLEYILDKVLEINPKKIILLCCYKKEQFIKKFHNKIINKSKIICITEKKPLGTAGSILNAKKFISNSTLIINGDSYFNFNYKILNFINKRKKIHIILTKNNNYKSNKKLSKLVLKNNLVAISLNEKHKKNLMNGGIYIVKRDIIPFLKKRVFSLENETIPNLINKNMASGTYVNKFFIDIGTKKNLNHFKKISKKIKFNNF